MYLSPDLIEAMLADVKPRSSNVGQEVRNAIQAVLRSATSTDHWQKLLLMDETVFERILLRFAKYRDPKLGKIFADFIHDVQLILVPQPTDQAGEPIERFKEIPRNSQFDFVLENNVPFPFLEYIIFYEVKALPYDKTGTSIWIDNAGDAR